MQRVIAITPKRLAVLPRFFFSSTHIKANIELLKQKKNEQTSYLTDSPKLEHAYMRFFNHFDEILFDETIHYDINQTSFFPLRILRSNFFSDSARLRILRVKNISDNYIYKLLQTLQKKKGKIPLEVEGFCCLNFIIRSRHINSLSDLNELIESNKHIFENFSSYKLMRKIEILQIMEYFGKFDENATKEIITELKELIKTGKLWGLLRYHWDYFSFIQFLTSFLPTYIKEEEIKELYNPVFLNKLKDNIKEEFKSLEDTILFVDFIELMLFKFPSSYIMFEFNREVFFHQWVNKL